LARCEETTYTVDTRAIPQPWDNLGSFSLQYFGSRSIDDLNDKDPLTGVIGKTGFGYRKDYLDGFRLHAPQMKTKIQKNAALIHK